MIQSAEHAALVQQRRRKAGLKGRSKAVRRWFKREFGRSIDAHSQASIPIYHYLADYVMQGDFTGCRRYDEVHK